MEVLILSLCAIMPAAVPMNPGQVKNVCKYEKFIEQEARKNNISPYLLASVIYVESAFLPHVVSRAGACGLTQVIPKWTGGRETRGKKYTCEQLKNPVISIRAGARILAYSIYIYAKGNIDKGICYYNAGNKCVKRKKYYKKLKYVKKVKEIWNAITDGY